MQIVYRTWSGIGSYHQAPVAEQERRHWQRDWIIIIVCILEPHYLPKYPVQWWVPWWAPPLTLWLLQLTNKSFRSAAINGNTSAAAAEEDSPRHSFRSLVLGHLLILSSGETSSIYYYQFSDDVNPSPSLIHHVPCMHYKSAEQNMHSQLHKEVNEMHHNSVRRISPDDTFSHTQLLLIRIRMAIEWTRPATIRQTHWTSHGPRSLMLA